ncbi:hypothetical protein WN48_10277 [Eufriesea mexicana]|uniref:Uncharacterized protein n=1 Tax=Eufriesea mexicana TaxID=516756 RepID=A0A310S6R0_9HYME|nr:hypothetical protein WN48_10277 [Eufriesea mexicana]
MKGADWVEKGVTAIRIETRDSAAKGSRRNGGRRVGGKAALWRKKDRSSLASVTPWKLDHTSSLRCHRTSENRNGAGKKGSVQSPTSNRRVTVCGAVGRSGGRWGVWRKGGEQLGPGDGAEECGVKIRNIDTKRRETPGEKEEGKKKGTRRRSAGVGEKGGRGAENTRSALTRFELLVSRARIIVYVDDFGELGKDIVRYRVTVGSVCGATGPVCSGTVSGTKKEEETVATGPPAEACAPGGVGGAGKPRGTVLGPAEKLEAVKVASSLGLQGPSAPIGAQLLATGGSEDAPSVYHANLLASSNASVLQQPVLASLNTPALASMQASAEANSLDIQAMQSMDWLFKKERIYLLAQFWQQVRGHLADPEFQRGCEGGEVSPTLAVSRIVQRFRGSLDRLAAKWPTYSG